MKKVHFGENETRVIDDISKYLLWPSSFPEELLRNSTVLSHIRERYVEKNRSRVVSQICELICDHTDVYHVDIYVNKDSNERFVFDLVNSMECVFQASKGCTLSMSNKTLFCFKDGFSNPSISIDDNFKLEENWEC